MVPRMQGDIIDTILTSKRKRCHVIDPFVGSGTVMSEAQLRGIDFTGIDINPLAVLICQAKAAIDCGINIDSAAKDVRETIECETGETIDVEFPGREQMVR